MNRQSLLITIILLIISTVASAQFTNDIKLWYNLHGNVKSCTDKGYNFVKGDTTQKFITSFDSIVFNKKGQIIETFKSNTIRGADINKRIFTSYKYDRKGNIIEQLYHNTDGIAEAKLVYSYSTAKDLISLRVYFLLRKDSSFVSETYKTDASGRTMEKNHYNEGFAPGFKYQYQRTVYKYDANGLRVGEVVYDLNGLEESRMFRKYNPNNEMSETAYVWLKDERANEAMAYTYVKYDRYHNWLIRNRFIHGRLHSVNERQITYYK